MPAFEIVVPALTLQANEGAINFEATREYAVRAAATWVDYFILSGSTTRGNLLSVDERAAVLDLWLEVTEPERLLPCCWVAADLSNAAQRGVRPMAVLKGLSRSEAIDYCTQLPDAATIYSHPMFGGVQFDGQLAADLRQGGALPSAGKVAKITSDEVRAIQAAAGEAFRLWDGSSRRIATSLSEGAAGVVATPLSPFQADFPPRSVASIQRAVDAVQAGLDALPTRAERTKMLMDQASSAT
ncbi:hypothetical protein [Nocardia asteroides]|uniref:hypothetical protein n=1 Tax=Nocardia asteroides TaxID=1824 RepID=UPI001E3AD7BA|nr:hypothetical protein [Nocardia asteroides]UGT63414.1 hypothetical protein LTT61_08910 [Nocardia asteroides]